MKFVVIGGSGLIGGKVVNLLRAAGHDVVPASPATGVNAVTGEGLAEALAGAHVVVDVANSPSFEDTAVLEFFRASAGNLVAAARDAGVAHLVALSVVGADRLPDSGYLRAKIAQEDAISAGGVPFTIVRATQFYEFSHAIAQAGLDGDTVRLPPALFQPVAADDVAATVADVAQAAPVNGIVELAGPEPVRMDEHIRRFLAARQDTEPVQDVTTDPHARYFGAELDDTSLTPGPGARIGAVHFVDWLGKH
ncbi:NAD(P)H-binding protein [Dactylosporangium aurantiacum]|uniref:NAD(P)H-binding protein n=1 Tax=Dactylosporangium aurantiacum TaxID=35754 RepID=A0A9Q9I9M6_9ACTN|nr:NAD(P)H-binding protein [Dactylosporangium aurantiacum]MDG6105221.1 NAD(P)H-binding protein [Dactylosporangium aurantiacum]UWZ51736.1 NAD(P)H-binding protein [Dactylosporangium aurantiacum]